MVYYLRFFYGIKEDFQIILCVELDGKVAELKRRIHIACKACSRNYGSIYIAFYSLPQVGEGGPLAVDEDARLIKFSQWHQGTF